MIYSLIAIALIIGSILLVTFNKLGSKWYVWLIYFSGLFTAYSTTMIGMSVVGSDISRELLMSNLALQNGWDLSLYDPSNTSVVVGWFVPFLSQIFSVEPQWIYKVVLPMIFAFTPAILYHIFRKQIGDLKAFYASMFFIIVPVYALEICTIGKSMVAETLMALTLYTCFSEWKQTTKFVIMLPLVLLTLWAHYTIGILLCIYLGGIFAYNFALFFITNREPHMQVGINNKQAGMNALILSAILCLSGIFFMLYYMNVAQGLIWNSSTSILHSDVGQSLTVINKSLNANATAPVEISATVKAYSLVKSALGLDLLQYSWSGIAFRIVQLLTQLLIVIGFGWMIWKRNYPKNGILTYRWKPEFVAGCFVALGLLGLCVLVPAFASLINATRQYHLSLFFLSPMFVIAFDAVGSLKRWRVK
jgi:uncharacterized membrane protein